jgi:alanine racemase
VRARLTVDLSALTANYRLLREQHHKQACAAVVKADAYGLGAAQVSTALWAEGCRQFYVATLAEAIALRDVLPEAFIGVFQGLFAHEAPELLHHRLTPVLNTTEQLELFSQLHAQNPDFQAILHIDTGMTRLGLNESELREATLPVTGLCGVMSHLACASEPEHRKNAEQLERFRTALALLPPLPASLSNSAGIFLGSNFHFDVARPGCALYGINPAAGPNPMQHVATLTAPILQVRELDRDEHIGYGASYRADEGSLIAIAALGYADGLLRCLGNDLYGYVGEHRVPLVGRVSMDMVAFDVSNVPSPLLEIGAPIALINATQPVDVVAERAGTIGYEVFTRIGARVERCYTR